VTLRIKAVGLYYLLEFADPQFMTGLEICSPPVTGSESTHFRRNSATKNMQENRGNNQIIHAYFIELKLHQHTQPERDTPTM